MKTSIRSTLLQRGVVLIGAFAMAFALMLAWAPTAQAADEYPLFVSGTQVTSDNATDVLGDGTVAFDADTLTLTLTDANIVVADATAYTIMIDDEVEYHPLSNVGIIERFAEPFTIELVGDSTISFDGTCKSSGLVAGIFSTASGIQPGPPSAPTALDLNITGDGTLAIDMAARSDLDLESPTLEPSYGMVDPYELDGIHMDGNCVARIESAVSISVGGPTGLSALTCKAYHGMILMLEDATFDAKVGVAMQSHGIYCMYAVATGSSKVTIDVAPGSSAAYAIFGGINATGDSVVDLTAGAAYISSGGILAQSGTLVDGNARLTAVSGGLLDLEDYPFGPGDSGAPDVPLYILQSAGVISSGPLVVSDNATFIATGEQAAVLGTPKGSPTSGGISSITIDISEHAVGGAIVSEDFGLAPAGTSVWDGVKPLVCQRDPETGDMVPAEPFRYVRIPGTPLASRIAGDYANETAAAISKIAFPGGSEWVVIARDDDFADALGATGLAGTLKCPIVLTDRFELSDAAAEEIQRLGATNAYVIGGTGAIKEQVDADLAAIGVEKVERLWGENSYDTSLACAKKIVELGGDDESVVIAMSTNFQDALSFSPIAYKYGLPVILQTWGDTSADRGFTDEAAAWLAGKELTVVGGPGAISDASVEGYELFKRVYGETGYDTSNEIAKWATDGDILDDGAAVIACGAQAPRGVDALAGAALAGKLGCPVLLVSGNDAMEEVNTVTIDGYLSGHADSCLDVYVLGGGYVIPQDIVDKIEALFAPEP